MPCAMPPWICPSTIMWLMMRPMSSTLVIAATSTTPVSGSISISQTCAPLGQDGAEGVSVAETRMRFSGWRCGERGELDRAVGAGDGEAAVAVLDVRRRRLQRLGGELLAARDHRAARRDHRRAADERRARADAADAVGAVGVALHDANFFGFYSAALR